VSHSSANPVESWAELGNKTAQIVHHAQGSATAVSCTQAMCYLGQIFLFLFYQA